MMGCSEAGRPVIVLNQLPPFMAVACSADAVIAIALTSAASNGSAVNVAGSDPKEETVVAVAGGLGTDVIEAACGVDRRLVHATNNG